MDWFLEGLKTIGWWIISLFVVYVYARLIFRAWFNSKQKDGDEYEQTEEGRKTGTNAPKDERKV